MKNKKYLINDLTEFAKKYGVSDAAIAYEVSKSLVYRYLSSPVADSNNLQEPYRIAQTIQLDFQYYNLVLPRIFRKKNIPGLYLIIAKDLKSSDSYFALCSEQNKTNITYFFQYLGYQLKKVNPSLQIENASYPEKSLYRIETGLQKTTSDKDSNFYQKTSLFTGKIIHELQNSLTDYDGDKGVRYQLAIIFANQLLSGNSAIQPVYINTSDFSGLNNYLSQEMFFEKYLEKQVNLFFSSCEFLYKKADTHFFRGETEKTIAICDKLLSIIEKEYIDSNLQRLLARICLLNAKANSYKFYHERAIKLFEKAIGLDPENGDAHYKFSVYYLTVKETELSKQHLLSAKKAYSKRDSVESRCRLYEILGKLNYQYDLNFHNAAINFRKMKDEAASNNNLTLLFEAKGYLGNIYYLNNSLDLAETVYQENIELAHLLHDKIKLATAFYNLALIYRATGHYEKAEIHISKSIILSKKSEDFYTALEGLLIYAEILLNLKKYKKTLNVCNTILNDFIKPDGKNPDLIKVYIFIASVFRQQQHIKKAISYFNLALNADAKTDSKNYQSHILYQLADMCFLINDYSKAANYYKKILKILSDNAKSSEIRTYSCFKLGKIFLKQNKNKKAMKLLTEAHLSFKNLHLRTGIERYKNMYSKVSQLLKTQ